MKFNDIDELDAAITDETAALVLEVIQGEGGVNEGDANFLTTAQRLCRDRGALLIIDEIQTGFGRTGKMVRLSTFQPDPGHHHPG